MSRQQRARQQYPEQPCTVSSVRFRHHRLTVQDREFLLFLQQNGGRLYTKLPLQQ
jgi:hypothetical protein